MGIIVWIILALAGFLDLSIWVIAVTGGAVLLLAYHLVKGRRGGARFGGRARPRVTSPSSPPTARSDPREGGA